MGHVIPLVGDYVVREVSAEEFDSIFKELRPQIFGDIIEFPFWSIASDEACAAHERLKEPLRDRLRLCFVVCQGDRVVGWTCGVQETSERYAMSNSGVLPEHRGRGIYSALLRMLLERLRGEGFQVVTSHHHPNNRAVLVPKLRAGFLITGMEISEIFGLLVNLSYFFDERRREAFEFRTGWRRPGEVVRDALRL